MSDHPQEKSSGIPESLRDLLHRKEAICADLENLANASAVDYQNEIARLSADYDNAGALPQEYAELMDKRFTAALQAARAGESAFIARQEKAAKLQSDVDALLAADELATLAEVEKLEKSIAELAPGSDLAARLAPLKSRLEAEEAAVKAAENAVNALADELLA